MSRLFEFLLLTHLLNNLNCSFQNKIELNNRFTHNKLLLHTFPFLLSEGDWKK